jgi:hypothetical protein
VKRLGMNTLIILSIVCLANWSSEETSVSGSKKLAVNFYGQLHTWDGEQHEVDNLAIGRTYHTIVFYAPPSSLAKDHEESKEPSHQSSHKYILASNPEEGVLTKLDLKNIKEIRTPNPDVIWTYQKGKNQSKQEFIEVQIISADNTKSTYLIDTRRKTTCDLIGCNNGKAISKGEKEVPFKKIKSLVIQGHSDRDASSADRACTTKSSKKSKARDVTY